MTLKNKRSPWRLGSINCSNFVNFNLDSFQHQFLSQFTHFLRSRQIAFLKFVFFRCNGTKSGLLGESRRAVFAHVVLKPMTLTTGSYTYGSSRRVFTNTNLCTVLIGAQNSKEILLLILYQS